jgi:hypothetical protein
LGPAGLTALIAASVAVVQELQDALETAWRHAVARADVSIASARRSVSVANTTSGPEPMAGPAAARALRVPHLVELHQRLACLQ